MVEMKCDKKSDKGAAKHPIRLSPLPTISRMKKRRGAISIPKEDLENQQILWKNEDFYEQIPAEVFAALNRVEVAKENRKKSDVLEKLKTVRERVSWALEHCGMESYSKKRDSKETVVEDSPGFDAKQKREELVRQRSLLDRISEYLGSLTERQALLQDINDWLFSTDDLADGTSSVEEMAAREKEYKAMDQEVGEAFKYAHEVADRIKEIGYFLLKEAGFVDEERLGDNSFSRKYQSRLPGAAAKELLPKDLLDENQILSNPCNFEAACNEVKNVFEQATKLVRRKNEKNVLRHGQKQFKFLNKAMEKRISDMLALEEDVSKFKIKCEQLGRMVDRWKTNHDRLEAMVNNQDAKILRLQARNKELEEGQAQLQGSLEAAREDNQRLQQENEEAQAVIAIKEVVVEKRKSSVKQLTWNTESLINAATHGLQTEIETLQAELEEERAVVEQLQEQLKEQEDKSAELSKELAVNAAITSEKQAMESQLREEAMFRMMSLSNENDSLERQVTRLKTELTCKDELIEYQEERITTMKQELGLITVEDLQDDKGAKLVGDDAKRAMFYMKREFDFELGKLKSHLEKERNRNDASVRKANQQHKEQMLNVHRQSLHLLRAINRFKESVALILDRENLHLAAHDVRRIPDLSTDNCPADAKILLAGMAKNAVELLVTIEFKLSQALMNKRLEIKDNSFAKNFAAKDLQIQIEVAQKARLASENMADRLREVNAKLASAENTILELRKEEGLRYQTVSSRYKDLMGQYSALQKDMAKVQKENKETLHARDEQQKALTAERDALAQSLQQQQKVIEHLQASIERQRAVKQQALEMSMADMRHNLQLLEQAFSQRHITRHMYTMTAELVKQCLRLPGLKLAQLMRKYIAFRALKDAKAQVQRQLEDKLLSDRKEELQAMVHRVDDRIEQSSKIWQQEQAQLDKQKEEMVQKISDVFREIAADTGLLLIEPVASSRRAPPTSPSSSTIYPRSTRTSGTATTSSLVSQMGPRLPTIPAHTSGHGLLPAELSGQRVRLGGPASEPLWGQPDVGRVGATLTTPLLLGLDMQQHMRAAQRVLKRTRRRLAYPLHQAQPYNIQDYMVGDLGGEEPQAGDGEVVGSPQEQDRECALTL